VLLLAIIADEFRLLTFRHVHSDMHKQWKVFLSVGLFFTWLAGIGRYWDNNRAHLWQHLGLGSVAYVFCLSLVIWLLLAPLRPRNWRYRHVLVFITLTSLPALIYAIPVEMFFSLSVAQTINIWFLAVVATWRVALLIRFLKQSAGLNGYTVFVATLLPLVVIVNVLSFLNLEHVIFKIMGGLQEDERTGNDAAYAILWLITALSYFFAPIILSSYVWLIWKARKSK